MCLKSLKRHHNNVRRYLPIWGSPCKPLTMLAKHLLQLRNILHLPCIETEPDLPYLGSAFLIGRLLIAHSGLNGGDSRLRADVL
jgi:hypothetical protein